MLTTGYIFEMQLAYFLALNNWPKRAAVLLVMVVGYSEAGFSQLLETCRTTTRGLGICVQNQLCCQAVRGFVPGPADSVPSKRQESSSVLQTSDFGDFANNNIKRRDSIVGAGGDCSYNGVCCVLPTLHDYDCSSCGLWGDGVRHKVTSPKPSPYTASPALSSTTTPIPLLKKITERIVGGQDAPVDRWCWQVAILDKNGLIGSGALIARNWVLTAAHLVAGRFLDELMLALNLHNFVQMDPNREVFYTNPIGAVIEEGYNPATWANNLALLRIPDAPCSQAGVCTICLPTSPFTFQSATPPSTSTTTTTTTTAAPTTTTTYSYGAAYISPLKTVFDPTQALQAIQKQMEAQVSVSAGGGGAAEDIPNPYERLVCEITGWGMTGTRPVSPVLQEAFQQVIRPVDCEDAFVRLNVPEEKINIPDGAFCVQDPNRIASSCVGDGGSPLACQNPNDNSWVLRGIVILGTNMCMNGVDNGPTIVANVGEFLEWIRDTVQTPLPTVDTAGGRNAYRVPACGESFLNKGGDGDGGCPQRIHADGVLARNLIVTGGLPYFN